MVQDESGALHPFELERIYDAVPLLHRCNYDIDSCQLDDIIDSSNMTPDFWVNIADIIEREYNHYDGFCVLHGTDTMAYSASALSFVFENLGKPIVLTGSQLPLGMLRSDGRDNIIDALEIASGNHGNIPEVCVFFEDHLYRGNRSTKVSAENFAAFHTYNYPTLADAGININIHKEYVAPMPASNMPLIIRKGFDRNIAVLKLFPGITSSVVNAVLHTPNLRGVILETYGSGNAPTGDWFLDELREAIERGILIMDVTQCKAGAVKLKQYEASVGMERLGVLSGHDITIEAAVTKMMYILGSYGNDRDLVHRLMDISLRGEMTV